jgi:hypothetical protein
LPGLPPEIGPLSRGDGISHYMDVGPAKTVTQ